MKVGFSRTLARSVVLPYVCVFAIVLAIFAIGVHFTVSLLAARDARARLDTLARAAIAVTDAKDTSYVLGEQADSVANPADQRVTWLDRSGRVVGVRGASAGSLGAHALAERVVPVADEHGRPIGFARIVQSDERREGTLRGVDVGLAFGFVLATLTSIVGGRFLSRKALARIVANVRSLEEFSANAAHELRTPLAAIIANAEASLRAGTLGPHDAHRARTVVAAATSMRRVSDDLLTLALPTNGAPSPTERHRIDLEEIVAGALADVAPLAERGAVTTEGRVEGAPWVFGEPGAIQRLVVNLLENAVRYTRPGGRVEVEVRNDRGDAVVVVRDTGIGISPHDRGHIFERFWRADQARRVGDGSGLGLSIVEAIVARHGGTIRVESELGTGSVFSVRLPQSM